MDRTYKAALELERRARQLLDNAADANAKSFCLETKRLCEEIEMKRSKDALLQRLKSIEQLLNKSADAYSHGDHDDMQDRIEDLRSELQSM